MKKIILSFLTSCTFSFLWAQNNLVEYQYWFDSDYTNANSGVMSSNEFLSNIAANTLSPGEHQIHFRIKQSDGKWSCVISQKFNRPIHLIKYEYWLDENYANRISANTTNIEMLDLNTLVDGSSLSSGLHTFSFRSQSSNNQWSSTITQKFIVSSEIDKCEFWFDKDYANRTQVNLSSTKFFLLDSLIDASNLFGNHEIHYRTHQTRGEWSSVLSQNFVKQNQVLAYEYWFNDDYANRILQAIPNTGDFELSPTINVSTSPLGSNILFLRFKDETGKWSQVITNGFCHNDGDSAITIKIFLEGYYQGSGLMASVMQNQGVGSDALVCDSIDVELRQTTSPFALVESKRAELKTNGLAKCYFNPSINGSYYVAVKHRHSVTTWSSIPVYKGTCPTYYDFTSASTKAYGNNLVEVENGVWATYSGDINQDENVDLLDMSILDNDISNFLFGYFASDINGDGNVDLLDSPMTESNVNAFVFSAHP